MDDTAITDNEIATIIQWMPGVIRMETETHIEGNALVFGCRIDSGDFQENFRLVCDNPKDLSAMAAMAGAVV